MLPSILLSLVSLVLSAHAQSRIPLSLNSVTTSNSATSFSIPGQDELTITVALCSVSSPSTRFFISNSTNSGIEDDPGLTGGEDVHEIVIQDGFGNWVGAFPNGGVLAVENLPPGASFEVGVSNNGRLHDILPNDPFFGDSTSNQAILFSHTFADPPLISKPQYPNYTLPAANPPLPSLPSSSPNLTLIVTQTSTRTPLLRTACFLNSSAISTTSTIVNSSLWLRSPVEGWRTEYLLAGLLPSTNYTAFIIQDQHKVSGPIYFLTKSPSFSCTLVHALPYCPSTTYSLPLPPPPNTNDGTTDSFPIYNSSTLPTQLSTQLLGVLTNFTTSLSTFACGRDWYSPLVDCSDCAREYRRWLCATLFPRCTEPSASNSQFITPDPSSTGLINAGPTPNPSQQQQAVFSALAPIPSPLPTSSANLGYTVAPYTKLLPCIELCTSVDRACPPFIGFRCPSVKFNGAATYGFGYVDGSDGSEGRGVTGVSQDRWGNVWCHAG